MPVKNKLSFYPFPEMETERLKLRKLKWEDQQALYELHSDKENRKYISSLPPESIQDTRKFIDKILSGIEKNDWIYWVISSITDNQLVGTICLWDFSEDKYMAELGYELLPRFQGKGFMAESVKKVEQYAFEELHLRLLEGYTHRENEASARLLTKLCYHINEEKSKKHNEKTGETMCVYFKMNE